jgi:hypothetical protein
MSVRRLHWQGTTRERALRARLDAALDAWRSAWCVQPERWTISPAEHTTDAPPSALRWYRADGRTGTLWFGATGTSLDTLGARLADASGDDGYGIGERVGERAVRALLLQWLGGAANAGDVARAEAPRAEDLDPRFGACHWRIAVGGTEWNVIADDALCAHLAPEASVAPTALTHRISAVAGERVALPVVFDFGPATLAEAHGLQVGDVLVSGARLDTDFQLANDDGRNLAAVRLHRTGAQLAVQVRAPNSDRKPA